MPGENLLPSITVMVLSLFLLCASAIGLNCMKDKTNESLNKRILKISSVLSIVGILLSLIIMYMSSHSDMEMQ